METRAMLRAYMEAHVPGGTWCAEAERTIHACIRQYRDAGEEALRQYVIAWAEVLADRGTIIPTCAKALFFALDETGEERFRTAISKIAAEQRRQMETVPDIDAVCESLPFLMAYETKLNGMERVGQAALAFRRAHRAYWDAAKGLFGGDLRSTARYLLALTDTIRSCSNQLYEHWRALVDLYREALRGALNAEGEADREIALMLIYPIIDGVQMGIIDPERYLPVVRKRIAVLDAPGQEMVAEMLKMEGGAC